MLSSALRFNSSPLKTGYQGPFSPTRHSGNMHLFPSYSSTDLATTQDQAPRSEPPPPRNDIEIETDSDSDDEVPDSLPIIVDDDGNAFDDPKAVEESEKIFDTSGRYVVTDVSGKPTSLLVSQGTLNEMKRHERRDKYVLKHFGLSWKKPNLSPRDLYVLSVFYSVSANTFQSYASHWNKLRKGKYALNQTGLIRYFNTCGKNYASGSLTSFRSAVKMLKVAFIEDLECDDAWKYFENGYCRTRARKDTKKRGAITRPLLDQLCNHKKVQSHKTSYSDYFRLQYALGIRSNQVPDVHVDHFRAVKDKVTGKVMNYLYVVSRNKDSKAHKRSAYEHHVCDPESFEFLTNMIEEARKNKNGYLAPGWNNTEALNLVKEAAKDLNWTRSLNWCNHSIRHGACLDAADAGASDDPADRLAAGKDRLAHESVVLTKTTYGVPNEKRALASGSTDDIAPGIQGHATGITTITRKGKTRATTASVAAVTRGTTARKRKAAAIDKQKQNKVQLNKKKNIKKKSPPVKKAAATKKAKKSRSPSPIKES